MDEFSYKAKVSSGMKKGPKVDFTTWNIFPDCFDPLVKVLNKTVLETLKEQSEVYVTTRGIGEGEVILVVVVPLGPDEDPWIQYEIPLTKLILSEVERLEDFTLLAILDDLRKLISKCERKCEKLLGKDWEKITREENGG